VVAEVAGENVETAVGCGITIVGISVATVETAPLVGCEGGMVAGATVTPPALPIAVGASGFAVGLEGEDTPADGMITAKIIPIAIPAAAPKGHETVVR
jgi:hypothetical protein